MKFFRQNRRIIAVLAVVLGLVFLISYTSQPRDGVTLLEAFLIEFLAPVQRVAEQTTTAVEDTVGGIARLGELQAENKRLKERLAEMSHLAIELQELRRENLELEHTLGLVRGDYGELDDGRIVTAARVVGRNADNWFRHVEINRGTADGVEVDMVAIQPPRILVGRIIKATENTATVMLLSDPESGVGGMALKTRDAGVVLGGGYPAELLEMQFFSREAQPYEGQIVVTSGLGKLFPRDLLVGTVKAAGNERQGVVPVAYLEPFADLDHLRQLVVVERTGK